MKLKTVQTTCLLGIKQEKWKRSKKHHPKLSDSLWYQGWRAMDARGWLRDRIFESIRKYASAGSFRGIAWPTTPVWVREEGREPHAVWAIDPLQRYINVDVYAGTSFVSRRIYLSTSTWCWTFQEALSRAMDDLCTQLGASNA